MQELPDSRLIMWACVPVAVDIVIIILQIALDHNIVQRVQGDSQVINSNKLRQLRKYY